MSGTFRPHGVWTALTTPFSTDRQVDYDSLRRLIEFQVQEGVDGVLPCGTTGESPTLSWQEHDAVIDASVRAVEGRTGVLAGAGSNNTQEAIRASTQAKEAGATAVLLVDCYYNGPSSLELRTEYYERILQNVPDIPVVPYVIPGRSGCALSAADLAILHLNDPKRVPAVKQATGDLDRMRLDRQLAGPALSILSGDDELTLTMMRDDDIRACGVISVLSNIAPGWRHRGDASAHRSARPRTQAGDLLGHSRANAAEREERRDHRQVQKPGAREDHDGGARDD